MAETDVIDNLIGVEFPFYGATENQFKLGKKVFHALEDEDDGYRSYLGSVEEIKSTAIFFKRPIARVRLQRNETGSFDGYSLVDAKDDHEWLRFGTDSCEDYYPYFVFEYSPKKPKGE